MGRGCPEFLPLLRLPRRSLRATLLVLPGCPLPTSRTSWTGNVDTAGRHSSLQRELTWLGDSEAVAVKSERALAGWLRLERASVPAQTLPHDL